jgi:hypothetical protein
MSELKITGKIHKIMDTQTFDSGFQKREFVVETEDQYPQMVKFEVIKDKVTVLDQYSVGQAVDVKFNVRGNEYNGKFYVSLQAWAVFTADGGNSATTPEPANAGTGESDELPF